MSRSVGGFLNSWAGALLISAVLAAGLVFALDVNSVRSELFRSGKAHPVDAPSIAAHTRMAQHTPEAVERIFKRAGLPLHLYLLSPVAFGVETWTVGDRATYEYALRKRPDGIGGRRDLLQSQVTVEVVGDIDESHALIQARGVSPANQWLRISGLDTYRDVPSERYALMNLRDLRPSAGMPLYEYQPGYFPMPVDSLDLEGIDQLQLEPAGRGRLTTAAGSFDCDVYTSWIAGVPLRIWASPDVLPLGIVRISSDTEDLTLTGMGPAQPARPMNPGIEALLRGDALLDQGCMSCHPNVHDCHTNRAVPL